ncbi:uncharacterized protein [Haliotis cracherodii]|uniref:uncharacterized protein n=1 Tax=Haliotis cracherodii TaxID=6455 RepID=UPI0039EB6730
MAMFINCTEVLDGVLCNGTLYTVPEARLTIHDKMFWVYLAIYVGLVLTAGLMSGLTMGLLSLDLMTLNILKDGGTTREQKYARRILPLVKRHHLLLVTLLLANAAAVEAMPIFLDRISDPIIAISVSVSAVLIFGEVVPQALCTRFGLAIGSTLAPVVYILMGLFFIVSWPLSKLLDCVLGSNHGTFFRRAELKVLVDLHGPGDGSGNEEHLTTDEVLMIKGALDLKDKRAKDAMVNIDNVFMISSDACMDHNTMTQILFHGHSRIPVYEESRSQIKAVLLMKTLIKLDPEDAIPVSSLLLDPQYFRPVIFIDDVKPLHDLINLFQTGKGHLAVVRKSYQGRQLRGLQDNTDDITPLLGESQDDLQHDSPQQIGEVMGIITLEDVIEELLQEEIIDENDERQICQRIQLAKAMATRKMSVLKRSLSQPEQSRGQVQAGQSLVGHSSEHLNVDVAIATSQRSDDAPLLGSGEVLA